MFPLEVSKKGNACEMTFSFVHGLEVDDSKKSFINQCVGGEKVLLAIPHNLKFKSYNWITFKTPLYPPPPPPLHYH